MTREDKRLAHLISCDKNDLVIALVQAESAITSFLNSETLQANNRHIIRLTINQQAIRKLMGEK